MSRAIDAIIFDYGNVFVGWKPERLYQELISDLRERAFFLREICTPAWHHQHDQGAPMAQTVPRLQAQFPAYAREIAAWDERFGDMLTPADPEMVQVLVAYIACGGRAVLLSNMPAEKKDVCLSLFPRLDLFETIVVSGEEKLAKPDAAIFRLALQRLGLPAERVLFVDDLASNVAGARQIGLLGHQFRSALALAADLKKLDA